MIDGLQNLLKRLAKVPPEPEPPAGAPGSVRVFRAARGFLWYQLVGWIFKQVSAVVGLVVGLFFFTGFLRDVPYAGEWMWVIEVLGIAALVAQMPFSLLGTVLDYRLRWYIVTDRSLRIREGVFTVQEKTMSFANIQNLSVRQGPIQRALSIADLEVKSAGGGQQAGNQDKNEGDDLHTGYFRGVDNAEEIKEIILQRLRRLRDAGLGDPDEADPRFDEPAADAAPATTPALAGASPGSLLVDAAHGLLDEARRLRLAAERRSRAS